MKLLLYCTKAKPYLRDKHNVYGDYHCFPRDVICATYLNGKIVAECDFEVENLYNAYDVSKSKYSHYFDTDTLKEKELVERSCLSNFELHDYLGGYNGYAIHIKNLHIFDKPRELKEVYKIENIGGILFTKPLEKAPQNMMRISVNHWEYATYNPDDIRVLISIRPEWLCKILNGEKTIEIRKKVLKEML